LEKIGVKYITAIMTVFTDPKESENVAKKLSEAREVVDVSTSLSEELLIIAKVVAKDQDKLHSFIAQEVAPLPGVLRIRTSIITRKYKEEKLLIAKK
jgi:DNA-binding Lrp family transcriptional regulator